jgi:hypothetical protein
MEVERNTVGWNGKGTATVSFAAVGAKVGIWSKGHLSRNNNNAGTLVHRHVQMPCNNPEVGHWLCLTHQKHFVAASELQSHLSSGKHNFVWFCDDHGPEMDPSLLSRSS